MCFVCISENLERRGGGKGRLGVIYRTAARWACCDGSTENKDVMTPDARGDAESRDREVKPQIGDVMTSLTSKIFLAQTGVTRVCSGPNEAMHASLLMRC